MCLSIPGTRGPANRRFRTARQTAPLAGVSRSSSHLHEVGLQLRISVLLRPEIERNRGDLIYDWLGQPIPGEVHRLQIGLASVTTLHAHVLEFGGGGNREFAVILLAATRAQNSAKLPFGKTKRADQRAPSAIALLSQNPESRLSAAERADRVGVAIPLDPGTRAHEFGVGLEKRAGGEF